MYRIIGFFSKALRIFSSKSAINKIAYGAANFVPIAIPRTCKSFFIEFKNVVFSTISANSIRVLLQIYLLSLNSKNLRREVRPSLCGMLG